MEREEARQGLLYKTIKWLTHDRPFHICIYDVSGILGNNEVLQLPARNKVHDCSFCSAAKTTSLGMRFCIKCKTYSIKKAQRIKEAYVSNCYLGITEIVKPVFWNQRLTCIIYLGNLLMKEAEQEVVRRIRKKCEFTGVDEKLLLEALASSCKVDCNSVMEMAEITDILQEVILSQADTFKFSKERSMHLPAESSGKHWMVESMINHITMYYNRDLRLSSLAQMYFVNSKYLSRLFKKETGKDFSDFVNSIRINHAKQLLKITTESVTDISAQLGFNSTSYFNRVFKQYVGQTPREFRSLH